MSPKIGVGISALPFTLRPVGRLDMIEAAIAHMKAQDIRIIPGDLGARRAGLSGGWELDLGRRPGPGVNIVGALLLAWQPIAGEREDIDVVAARIIGASPAYLIGVEDGFEAVRQDRPQIQRALYLSGCEDGSAIRRDLMPLCDCGTSRMYWEPSCTGCDEAAFLESEKGEV